MKRWCMGVVVMVLLPACASAPVMTNAPDFALESLAGGLVNGSALWAGEPVLLVFMASWCAVCRSEVPELNALAAHHRVVAIASGDSRDALEKTRRETGMTYPVLLDDSGDVARAFGVVASPTCIVIDGAGVERYRSRLPPKVIE